MDECLKMYILDDKTTKMTKLFSLFFMFYIQTMTILAQSGNCTFIKNIAIKQDIYNEGAHGVKIDFSYNFDSLKTALGNDSVLSKSSFLLNISFSANSGNIKTNRQYKSLRNANGDASYTYTFMSKDYNYKDKNTCFIPYSALDIPEGKNTIFVNIVLSGKDGNGKKYEQLLPKQTVDIEKKQQRLMTFNVDYVEVDKTDLKGNAWDFSPFGYNTLPDVATAFTLGGVMLWKMSVENTNVFAVGPKSKNIIFKISEGDEVRIKITDVDLVFDDFIGELKVKPAESDKGTLHVIDKPYGKITGCNLNWKVE